MSTIMVATTGSRRRASRPRAKRQDGDEEFNLKYQLGGRLGSGAFGTVYRAQSRETGEEFAVKVINKARVNPGELKRLREEAELLQRLNHPNIIKFEAFFESSTKAYIVMELAGGGELFEVIGESGRFSEKEASDIMRSLLGAVAHMHKEGVIHRDLKPENILMTDRDNPGSIKVADFGLSKGFRREDEPEERRMTQFCGTMAFMAPELFRDRPYYSKLVDVWSCGVIAFLLLTGKHPFPSTDPEELRKQVEAGIAGWPRGCSLSDAAKDFVDRLIKVDPSLRYTAEEALLHPWITGAPDGELQPTVLEMMRAYAAERRLRKAMRTVVAMNTIQRHTRIIQGMFRKYVTQQKVARIRGIEGG
eukprot:CAMPEP_0196773852 /NCGR_PEP_ID=MMETSP1104-20130614/3024_1 /TAXON_ID=33652 /ORGANISM="Cafeteria sp., Strain Caron Lab Isolate" /LENGTH=361 /DNA_ID=CAMNT_0042144003 /DNA_START=36 /DNA_END=1117 /DNA_ORIENTATION=+